ncbi:Tafazzin-like protein [Chloropicon primus]|uniref:Tafazzin family protein n=2 Tax=Chloropicon primus TaxID=1764295 RepID=A0A5B8MD15_9CHLO|nr:Tafazzin-like protein [Chloropicon primus]UPQ97314.1 Tafazzin-like protein [Chloropicon primus]|eukprot:QDZ18101.1 Tafazzin-like protein [Chloropicon primus]
MAAAAAGKEEEELTSAPWGPVGRSFVLGATALVAQVYLDVFNTTKVHNVKKLYEHLYTRPKGEGLLTVSNHISTVDDPSLFCAFLPLSFFFTEHEHERTRWTMCAKEFCFKNAVLSAYFQNGKVLPIERGLGLGQPTVSALTHKLSQGDWVHIFPEGKISRTQKLGPMKWGTAKILCEGEVDKADPIVLPFYHKGLDKVLPIGSKVPRVGQKNTVVVGEPVEFGDLLQRCKKNHQKRKESKGGEDSRLEQREKQYYREIMDKIGKSLLGLEKECESLHK